MMLLGTGCPVRSRSGCGRSNCCEEPYMAIPALARDFKEFIRLTGMTHVRTAPYYPQSNGKLERYHKTIKSDAIRPGAPQTLDEARTLVAKFVEHYNGVRLHSAIGYITPADFLAGRGAAIWAERDRKLEAARDVRATRRAELHQEAA